MSHSSAADFHTLAVSLPRIHQHPNRDHQTMGWLYLALAILFEVSGTVSMKLSKGFTHPYFSALIFVCYGVSFFFLTFAVVRIELSIAYAVWSGVGITLIALIGLYLFNETMTLLKALSLLLVILGIIGLHYSSEAATPSPHEVGSRE